MNTAVTRTEEAKYSKKVRLKEISENRYNLNFPRYINKLKLHAEIDLSIVCNFLNRINEQANETEKKLISFCEELKIPSPVGSNIELLRLYKEGVMQKLFTRRIRFKSDDPITFPEWTKMRFGDVFSFRSTNSFSREKLNYLDGRVRNIHYGDIHTKFDVLFDITKERVPYINFDVDIDRIPTDNYCKTGDLIIADASEDYADIGKSIELINLNNEEVLAGLHTILARPDKFKLKIGFAGYLMKSQSVRLQIMRFAQGTKVLGISSKRIAEVKVEIPSEAEQERIVKFLVTIDDKINNNNSNIDAIEQYKRELLT